MHIALEMFSGGLFIQIQVFVKNRCKRLISAFLSVLILFLSPLVGAQSSAASGKPRLLVVPEIQIVVDSEVPAEFKELIFTDINLLKTLNFRDRNTQARKIFQAPVNSLNLSKWLSDRSRYILSENFEINASTTPVFRNYHKYINPTLPEFERGKSGGGAGAKVRTIMSNVGAQVYYSGKSQDAIFEIIVPGHGKVPVRSPRVGIFKIGAALFEPLISSNSSKASISSVGNSLARLKTYFHEARHSDGNGRSLIFGHAVCPEGHDLAGYNACDKNLNGPYTIGALFLDATISTCSRCSVKEREALRVQQLDSLSRVIKNYTVLTTNPQSVVTDSNNETCNQFRQMNLDMSRYSFCTQGPQSRPNTHREHRTSIEWDATPETAGPID